jgi:hypothetical protein
MVNHQGATVLVSEFHEIEDLLRAGRQRLFYEYMLACPQSLPGEELVG